MVSGPGYTYLILLTLATTPTSHTTYIGLLSLSCTLQIKIIYTCKQLAAAGSRCDYGLYVAGTKDNAQTVVSVADDAVGLKMYLNETFAMLKLDNTAQWMKVSRINNNLFSAEMVERIFLFDDL